MSGQPALGIERLLAVAQFEIEIGALERPAVAHRAHLVAAVHLVADALLELIEEVPDDIVEREK